MRKKFIEIINYTYNMFFNITTTDKINQTNRSER